jgi:pimeloyl-ACP methyl ester carboxylesterase
LTAGQAYLRAATYYRASLHRHPNPFDAEVAAVTRAEIDAFERFLALTNYPCSPVDIPYENTTLPGYWCPASAHGTYSSSGAPTILFNEGKDGYADDGKYVVDEAQRRGYNVLLWDGPGMGKVIRLTGAPFRADWEAVVSSVVDFVLQQPHVDPDQVAMISISLGGYLGPRAAVYEHRIKALIPNPGVMNWFAVYEQVLDQIDPNLMALLHSNATVFDETIYQYMARSTFLEWGLVDSMWHHGVEKPWELMLELERYQITTDMAHNITASTLVIDAEAEERGQALELYQALSSDIKKTYLKFTAKEAAQFHAQLGATAILSSRMFDWLDDVFVMPPASSTVKDDNLRGTSFATRSSTKIGMSGATGMMMLVAGFLLY